MLLFFLHKSHHKYRSFYSYNINKNKHFNQEVGCILQTEEKIIGGSTDGKLIGYNLPKESAKRKIYINFNGNRILAKITPSQLIINKKTLKRDGTLLISKLEQAYNIEH